MRISRVSGELSQFQNVQIMWRPETEIDLGCWVAFVHCHVHPDPHLNAAPAFLWIPIRLFDDYRIAAKFAAHFNATREWEAMEIWSPEYA